MRGGFPESLLAASRSVSFAWREAFIRAIVERDVPNLGSRVPPETLFRFLRMLAHQHGQIANFSGLGSSLGVSGHTVRQYLDLMAGLFHIRILPSRQANLGKRLVKAPKVYIRDSGMLHALWGAAEFPDLIAHPSFGRLADQGRYGGRKPRRLARFPRARSRGVRTGRHSYLPVWLRYIFA